MAFKLYRLETGENLRETYQDPQRMILSGAAGPIAGYVRSVRLGSWELSERELAALVQPAGGSGHNAVLFEAGSDQPGHITFYRLLSLHGTSSDDTTDIVAHFKLLLNNHATDDLATFRKSFTVPASDTRPDIYENLKISGGIRIGTWKWMEIEQILTATVMSPDLAKAK